MLTAEDLLVVTNLDDHDITFRAGGRSTVVPVGGTKQVPFEAVRIQLGDPRSGSEGARIAVLPNGEKIRIRSRPEELQRLDILYGLGARKTIASSQGIENTETLADLAPKVSIATVDGTPVDTPVSDPAGDNSAPVPVDHDSQESLGVQLSQLQKQMDAVQARMADNAAGEEGEGDEGVTEDSPTAPRAPAGAAKKS